MAIALNTALQNYIVTTGVIAALGNGNAILRVYNGTRPGTAGGSTAGCALLVQIGTAGAGIGWNASTSGSAGITGNFTGTCGSTGTASWARLSDSGGVNYIIDGNVGTASTSDFTIDNIVVTLAGVVTLTQASIVQPGT